MTSKYAIFVVGRRKTGKSTLIRSLTGCAKNGIWNVRSLGGSPLKAFVSLSAPQELGMPSYPPQNFPQCIEDKYFVRRNDYDILISALELAVRNQTLYGYQQYIHHTQSQGFDIRIAVIETAWNGVPANPNEITAIQSFAQQRNIPFILANASLDPNRESSLIRQYLYP